MPNNDYFQRNGLSMLSLSIYQKEFRTIEGSTPLNLIEIGIWVTAVGNQSLLISGLNFNLKPSSKSNSMEF
jgi:hypothetical protein